MLKLLAWASLLSLNIAANAQIDDAAAKVFLDELFKREGPKVGEKAPDFTLESVTGGRVRASELWSQKPLIVTTGSYTCPQFRYVTPSRQQLRKEFGDRVNFVVVYTTEAHPVGSRSPYFVQLPEMVPLENHRNGVLLLQPGTFADRVERARKCREALHLQSSVAVDTMDDATWRAYGRSPNCGYLIGTDGRVALQQGLFDADEMRKALEKLLGITKRQANKSSRG